MSLVPMAELLARARHGAFAVPSFCVWNLETAEKVLSIARRLRSLVIVMSGPGEFGLVRPHPLSKAVRSLTEGNGFPVALHLDHGDSLELVDECLEAGFTSVMLDCSTRPYGENVEALRQVVRRARPRGVTVEGEIGHVGRADTVTMEGAGASALTDPTVAAAYVEATDVDALAVSIGNAHGNYPRLPKLDFDRLAAIAGAVSVPLVLHGGSGTPEADLRRAIGLGIRKVNIATDLAMAFRRTLLDQWRTDENPWPPVALAAAVRALEPVVERWIHLTGAAGRA